jgi:hypothetical protein
MVVISHWNEWVVIAFTREYDTLLFQHTSSFLLLDLELIETF